MARSNALKEMLEVFTCLKCKQQFREPADDVQFICGHRRQSRLICDSCASEVLVELPDGVEPQSQCPEEEAVHVSV